jgi:phospholipase/carboxylesterase
MHWLTRREWIRQTATGALALATGGCGSSTVENGPPITPDSGRLSSRPGTPTESLDPGLWPLSLGDPKDGFLYVPVGYRPEVPAPLALLFHGAGQRAHLLLDPMRSIADEVGMVLLAVDSREATWDTGYLPYRNDIPFVDRALALAFRKLAIDPLRVTVAGFSDGASYALSVGLINGDLFRRIAAFSPGYVADGYPQGKPKIFITHGTSDGILNINTTSRRLVPNLRQQNYSVEYHEFDGGHTIPADLLRTATLWLATAG